MRITRTFVLVWMLTMLGVGIYAADNASGKGSPANPAFEKLKTLVGTWETKAPDGKTVATTVRLTGNGSALVFESAEDDGMITVIYPDGEGIMATHYCGAGNQPRYVLAPSGDPNTFAFHFKDITNLASPESGHMRGVVFKIVDADHHTEDWTWRENGKEQAHTLAFARKK